MRVFLMCCTCVTFLFMSFESMPFARGDEGCSYRVTWETPSGDWRGSVPLGNGEVGANVWVDEEGNLGFFISRTDALDEFGRLVKVGGGFIRLDFGDASPEGKLEAFRQSLEVREGALIVRYGSEGESVKMRAWIDAYRPVLVVEIDTELVCDTIFENHIWRTSPGALVPSVGASDFHRLTKTPIRVVPDQILTQAQSGDARVGHLHHNAQTPGFDEIARTQGMDDFPRKNPLLHRTFGALVSAQGETRRESDVALRSIGKKRHVFEIVATSECPATVEEWLQNTSATLDQAQKLPLAKRREAHVQWWSDFWGRSWIHLSQGTLPVESPKRVPEFYTKHAHELRLGLDSEGKSRFRGELVHFSVASRGILGEKIVFQTDKPKCETIDGSNAWEFPQSGVLKVVFRMPETLNARDFERLFDKITAGKTDGFLLDISPRGELRLIVGRENYFSKQKLAPSEKHTIEFHFDTHRESVDVLLDGVVVVQHTDAGKNRDVDEPFLLTQSYLLQRYVEACAGRGNFPIYFNGSIFAVPYQDEPAFADYRRWGTGYWWQNTRLPYYSMFMSGDFDLLQPFFDQYAALLPLCEYRTKKYLGVEGAFYPECIYAWGDIFPDTYGTTPWDKRQDRLQSSRWHKWEWVSGLELAFLMLEYYEFSGDEKFLREKALPVATATLRFFDEFYPLDAETGKWRMSPSQALETWWDCLNPMPEIAGAQAVVEKLLALSDKITTQEEREYWSGIQSRIPPLPTWVDDNGVERLAPAQEFRRKQNIENPELYAVFPFRRVSFEKEGRELAINALHHRWDRGALGWRQEDIFMAYLGLAQEAREYLVERALKVDPNSRFPAFWGPNYDWTPDQCHGGVLTKGVQSLIMQTDGEKIFLFPAFPKEWNVEFKLHAPQNTTLEGALHDGSLRLCVSPPERQRDVIIVPTWIRMDSNTSAP
ncbi:MAG: DUF5703 domain-containing protein [Planctomycetia bacterium]|nr:DUF5703 domain-containing protein [Planctomycetia bacterium]